MTLFRGPWDSRSVKKRLSLGEIFSSKRAENGKDFYQTDGKDKENWENIFTQRMSRGFLNSVIFLLIVIHSCLNCFS